MTAPAERCRLERSKARMRRRTIRLRGAALFQLFEKTVANGSKCCRVKDRSEPGEGTWIPVHRSGHCRTVRISLNPSEVYFTMSGRHSPRSELSPGITYISCVNDVMERCSPSRTELLSSAETGDSVSSSYLFSVTFCFTFNCGLISVLDKLVQNPHTLQDLE